MSIHYCVIRYGNISKALKDVQNLVKAQSKTARGKGEVATSNSLANKEVSKLLKEKNDLAKIVEDLSAQMKSIQTLMTEHKSTNKSLERDLKKEKSEREKSQVNVSFCYICIV